MIRKRFLTSLTLALTVTLVAPSAASAEDPEEPVITFAGGGWGHGVGMSQYGALGRAEAGHTVEEILAFYYDGTTVEDRSGSLVDDLRIRLSPPSGGTLPPSATVTPHDGTALSVTIGETELSSLTGAVTVTLAEPTTEPPTFAWSVVDDTGELCPDEDSCVGATATVVRPDGAEISVSDSLHGDHNRHDTGHIRLEPDGAGVMVLLVDVPMGDYLEGIAEVPSSWPDTALQAQAIAARSYGAAKAESRRASGVPFDVFDSVSDQVYNGVAAESPERIAAVAATTGKVVVYEGSVVRTFYTSSNGGYTAASEDSFVTPEPFHIAKPDPFDPAPDEDGNPQNPYASWDRTYRVTTLKTWLEAYGAIEPVGAIRHITIGDVPPSGRVDDATVEIVGTDDTDEISGATFYAAINAGAPSCSGSATVDCDDLRSTNFRISSFTDVPFDAYYAVPVAWMAANDITTGTGPNTFEPEADNSRGGSATFMHRFADEPKATLPGPFTDVPEGIWYETAVAWLAAEDITTGVSPGLFAPEGTVSRAQAATFLWRFAGEPASTAHHEFTDVASGRYYTDAVRWMVEWGITTGTSPTTFSPDEPVTRGMIATFMWRLAGEPGAFSEGVVLPSSMRTA